MHVAHWLVRLTVEVLGVGTLAVIYFNASVNARANEEDDVVSMPGADSSPDKLISAIAAAAGQPAVAGNQMDLYQNGDAIFPPMLESIAGARSSVHFVT
jgi:hypothetical protein